MKPWLTGAALLFVGLSPAAWAGGSCNERCGQSLSRCAGTCGVESKCMRRCNDQFSGCVNACGRTEKPVAQQLPDKCTGPNGKTVPCSDYQKAPKLDLKGTQQQQARPGRR